jgi:hypothetical protein
MGNFPTTRHEKLQEWIPTDSERPPILDSQSVVALNRWPQHLAAIAFYELFKALQGAPGDAGFRAFLAGFTAYYRFLRPSEP